MTRNPRCRHCGCSYETSRCLIEVNGERQLCGYAEKHGSLCTAPGCLDWVRQFVPEAQLVFIRPFCVCGSVKRRERYFCNSCWHTIPWEITGALWDLNIVTRTLAFFDGVRWLMESSGVRVRGTELLRLAQESLGPAGKERTR